MTVTDAVALAYEADGFRVSALERSAAGAMPALAIAAFLDELRDETEGLVTERGMKRQTRRQQLVGSVRFDRASVDERVRWLELLSEVARADEDGRILPTQRDAMLGLWTTLRSVHPTLRHPAVRIGHDGTLGLAWSYAEPAGFVFTVEIDRDGHFDWYLRDPTREMGETSETAEAELPPHVVERLTAVAG